MRNNFRTDALARFLALQPFRVVFKPSPTMTAKEIEVETARLNALPKDQQMVIACDAMGFDVIEYLTEKAKFNGEALNELDMLDLDNAS